MPSPRYLALRALGLVPDQIRRRLVKAVAPSYMLGVLCWIERPDGRVLLLKTSYRDRWVFPGGLVDRGERPPEAIIREVREETGLRIDLASPPVVTIDPKLRRVEFTYKGILAQDVSVDDLTIDNVEIVAAQWFAPETLPIIDHEYDGLAAAIARSDESMQLFYATWTNGERFLVPGVN